MSALRLPGLGPIVGHTTPTTSRIWARADPATDGGDHPDAARRTMAVIGVLSKDGAALDPMPTAYFRLRREFDRSGSINLGADAIRLPEDDTLFLLEPDSEYEVRVGYLVLDDALDDDEFESDALLRRLSHSSAWRDDLRRLDPAKAGAVVRTFPAEGREGGRVSFLLGSCRYPGLLWKVRHSDRIFAPMSRLAEGKAASPDAADAATAAARADRPRFVLMVGDQIYADMFSTFVPFGRADTVSRVPRPLPDGVRIAPNPPPHAAAAHVHDPRRPRDRGQLVPGPSPPVGQAPALHDRRGRLHELSVEPRPTDVGPPTLLPLRLRRPAVLRAGHAHAAVHRRPRGRLVAQQPARPSDTFRFQDSLGREVAMDYRAWNFSQEDNFSHVTVDREAAELRVRVHDKRGKPVVEDDGRGGKVRLDARLGLAAW